VLVVPDVVGFVVDAADEVGAAVVVV